MDLSSQYVKFTEIPLKKVNFSEFSLFQCLFFKIPQNSEETKKGIVHDAPSNINLNI